MIKVLFHSIQAMITLIDHYLDTQKGSAPGLDVKLERLGEALREVRRLF